MSVVGFDFGTTNSLVSLIQGGRPINFFDSQGLPIPSVVCYEGARKIVGREAKERLASAGQGVFGNIVRSPKSHLGQDSLFVDGVERSVVDVVSDVIAAVRDQSLQSRGRQLTELNAAVVTIPVRFEGRRRAALREAFRSAGIRVVQFVHEPFAALYGFLKSTGNLDEALRRFDGRLVLVFDWGGGTLDLTLCRLEGGTLLQIANDGTDEVGGDHFDEAIRNEIVRIVRDNRKIDPSVGHHPDAMARLLHRCERAKIDLSIRDQVEVYVDHFFRGIRDDALSYRLTREQLEKMTNSLIGRGINRIETLLGAEGISAAQISLCLATGGMVNMPAIRSRLHEIFGANRVQVSDSGAAAIAEGAAWVAHDKATLQLAKTVELVTARNGYVPIVKAGTRMPAEGEAQRDTFEIYCADPRDGFAKFQFVAPARPGHRILPNDRRNPLATTTLPVHKNARPYFERLVVEAKIDDNLILHTKAYSELTREQTETEVHSLEFGISITGGGNGPGLAKTKPPEKEPAPKHEPGAIMIRANVVDRADPSLVPGELLYQHDPGYFDVRLNPPRVQVEERLYYEPCARCGRLSNDPLCDCGRSGSRPMAPGSSRPSAGGVATGLLPAQTPADSGKPKQYRL